MHFVMNKKKKKDLYFDWSIKRNISEVRVLRSLTRDWPISVHTYDYVLGFKSRCECDKAFTWRFAEKLP